MSSRVSFIVVAVVVVALAGAGAMLVLTPAASPPESVRPLQVTPTPLPTPPGAVTVTKPRAGRVLGVDEALHELDLIRPSRPKQAEDFTVKLVDGRGFRLLDHRGKLVFINFWATWCPPCLEEMPAMERLWRQHQGSNFVMLAISLDADPKLVEPFLKEHGLTFAVGLDAKMDLANAYGVRALPSSFIVGRQGDLAALALGPRAWDNDAAHSLIEGLGK